MDDQGQEQPPENNGIEDAYNNLELPRKNEVSIGEVILRLRNLENEAMANKRAWDKREVKEQLRAEVDYEQLKLRAPVEVAKGEKMILAVGHDAMDALGIIFDNYNVNFISRRHYATVELARGEDSKKIESELKFVPGLKPTTQNHLVVFAGLARELGASEGNDIRVTDVYQKASDLDLDSLR